MAAASIVVKCVNCLHHSFGDEGHVCDFVPDLVTGEMGKGHCYFARQADRICGPLGVLYEAKTVQPKGEPVAKPTAQKPS